MKKLCLAVCLSVAPILAFAGFSGSALAQSTTAGDIRGVVTDPTGATITGAKVTVTNAANGSSSVATTSNGGSYRVSLLPPGTYTVTVVSSGFGTVSNTVIVSAGQVASDDIKLEVGKNGTTVEVTSAPTVINTENGDVVTAYTSEQVHAMPNPGNDLTFIAQTAPGSVMNTGGNAAGDGYGNFSSFGISGLSNMFTLDGGYENDPFLNLNNTGASNLTLGNNEVDTVTVVAPAFSSQFGGLGGAQVNEITVGGGNRVHGNLNYYWNGRIMNANDWFNKQAQVASGSKNIPSFVNANQWSASIGGPIIRNRLFGYVNTEGIRVTTPASGQIYAPSTAYQNCSLTGTGCAALNAAADAQCAANNFNNSSTCVGDYSYGAFKQAPASQIPLLTRVFNTFNTSPYRPTNAAAITADPNDVTAVSYYAKAASFLTEWLLTARVDYKIGDKDNFFIHYKQDHGLQPTYTDLVSPLFSAQSPQPAWEGQMNETHVFSPNLVNQLVVTGNYYSAPFQNTNNYLAAAPFTFVFIDGDLGNQYYGGIDYAFPQGRRVAGYQVIDDINYTKGRNTLRAGYNLRRDNVTDLPQSRSVAPLEEGSVEAFGAGQVGYVQSQYFPLRKEEPIALYNMGVYAENSYKVMPNLTVTAGIRVERNSNPTCLANCLQSLSGPVSALATGTASTTVPYNAATAGGGLILAGRHRAFLKYQKASIMPRFSFAYQPTTKTVVRGGFGMFSDTFPGLIADTLLSNAPNVFHAAVYGSDIGNPALNLDPSTAGSGAAVATASANAFQTSFKTGGTYATTKAAVAAAGGTYSAPNFATAAPSIKYPTYEEFSLAVEQKLDSKSSITVTYVGNHGYHEPVEDGSKNLANAKAGAGFFASVPTVKPVTSLTTITNIYSGASSNYNGVVVSVQRRSKQITLQFNYQYSKALDEISNGGLEAFAADAGDATSVSTPGNLHAQYGPADYNVKQNLTGSFVWEVPSYHRFKAVTGGFEFSGTFFHQTGLPYTIGESTSAQGFSAGTVNLFAHQLNNNFDHHCGGGNHALRGDGTNPTPCNFTTSFASPTAFGQQGRNSLNGPSYTESDLAALKTFAMPFYEGMKLKLGAQLFNVFNHPNFQNPNHVIGTAPSTYGAITSTVSSPTSIYGSTGAASAPRLVQLKANLTF